MANKTFIVTDYEADRSLGRLNAMAVVPAKEFSKWPLENTPAAPMESNDTSTPQLSDVELRFLTAVVDHPMHSASEYRKLSRISPNTLSEIRPGLVERGYIREHKLEVTSGRGRAQIKLEPLEPAKAIVAKSRGK